MDSFKRYISKDEEIERAKNSNLKSNKIQGTNMRVLIHPGSRAVERRSDMKKEHWDDIVNKAHDSLIKKPEGHYIVYSKQHQQGLVIHHEAKTKGKMDIMTALPKGKSVPRPGTSRVVVEGVEYQNMEIVYVD